ncbi:UDP-N-acetyl-D-mannosaminuronic acid transferase [Xaviernesmea oryzae]|uniref:UDP-N-acetyl-D-mannosaminuronic acid transferase n=1 Tax=Xaviernesmea oryzae TaxID=464029 RepID=A0A1Q9ARS2_9HYPH|nr:WecB/TagA/CpsF family glycosyltransferase [Xaviernesmea oryzae]OLP58153.1 UDP-N-acetyl-D-mannosaminuronic acid transferase [Xaviernesmea oryzae]SEL80843.1 polymer biosynthesis protein, WecB/TagA/CpsF family [Xaviernesmea oryzae]
MKLFPRTSVHPPRRAIFNIPICDFGWKEALAFADEAASLPMGQTVISFMNANNANVLQSDEDYRNILMRHTVLPDGHGMDIASRAFHGSAFPANLNGTDFVPSLLTYMTRPRRVVLIGARPDILARATEAFKRHTPWHDFIAVADGFIDHQASREAMDRVSELAPDILLVAMGTPRQEKWVDRYVGPGHARLVLTVGALFDFVAGDVPRAPQAVRRMRLEWVYRLALEPKRLWRRYLLGIPLFFLHILGSLWAGPKPVEGGRVIIERRSPRAPAGLDQP